MTGILLRPWAALQERHDIMLKIVTGLSAGLILVTGLALSPSPALAQKVARDSMEQCVERVLTGLLSKKATDIEVGRAVIGQCDSQLKATLAEAIKNGEASSCTVEKCIQVARDEATREAKEEYRRRAQASR